MNDRSHATPPVNRFYPRALSSTVRGGKRKRKKEEHRQDTRKRLEVNLVAGLIIQTRRAARRCIVLEPISISSKRWTTNNRWRMPFKRQKVEVGDFETRAVIRRCLPPWTCLAIDNERNDIDSIARWKAHSKFMLVSRKRDKLFPFCWNRRVDETRSIESWGKIGRILHHSSPSLLTRDNINAASDMDHSKKFKSQLKFFPICLCLFENPDAQTSHECIPRIYKAEYDILVNDGN